MSCRMRLVGAHCVHRPGSKRQSNARLAGFSRSKNAARDLIRKANWCSSRRASALRSRRVPSSTKRCSSLWRSPRRPSELLIQRSAPPWRCAASTATIAAAVPCEPLPLRQRFGNVSGCTPRSTSQDDYAASAAAARSWGRCQGTGHRYGCARASPLRELRDQRWRGHLMLAGATRRAGHGRWEFVIRGF